MPSRDIKIAIVPYDIKLGEVNVNLHEVAQRLKTLDKDTDLVVLPEMFNTGFTAEMSMLTKVAEPDDGITINAVRQWALDYGIGIWGGFTSVIDGNYYNRGFMVDDAGNATFYNKRHLFRYGGESRLFTPGNELAPIVPFRSWNLKMSLCYDIRFPVWNRSRANEYDALIVPANWAHARFFAWKHMLIARAIENQAYVIGCNREGHDVYGEYLRGDSMAFNNWGDNISDLRKDGTVYAILNAEQLNRDRQKFAPWRDADDYQLIVN